MSIRSFLASNSLISSVAFSACLLPSTSVLAKEEEEETSALEIEEIIVTARKREELAIDVPIALDVFTGEKIGDRDAANLVDFLQEAPGVGIYEQGNGSAKITIRGISTSLGGNENGYYIDDLPFTGVTVPLSPDIRTWDLDRVEVLRGPQGTLFGDGSLGGTVRVIARDADLNSWEAKANSFFSTTQNGGTNVGMKGALNAPVVPGMLGVRLAATREQYEGWIDDDRSDMKDVNSQSFDTFRAKVRFDPAERLSINASYWYYKSDRPNGGSVATDYNQLPQSFVLDSGLRYQLYGGSARYGFDTVEAFYSYSRNKAKIPQSGTFLGGVLVANISVAVDAHELRFVSQDDSQLQWTVGTFLRDADRSDQLEFALFGLNNINETNSKAGALFGEATYTLPSIPVDFTAGLRYYREKVDGFEDNAGAVSVAEGDTYTSFIPRFGVAWRPDENTTFYANAAKGFRSGQLQPTVSISLGEQFGIDFPETLSQDSVWTYELGTKAAMLDGMATIQAAGYYSNWKDVTVRAPIGATGFNGLVNSNGIEVKGAEISLLLRPSEALTLAASGAYIDAKYKSDVAETGIVSGDPVDDVAKFTANASLEFRKHLSNDLLGTARIGWQHSSSRSFVSFPGFEPGDVFDRVDAQIGIAYRGINLAIFATNLTNHDGAVSYRTVTPLSATENEVTANRLRPRTIGISMTVRVDSPAS